MSDLSQALDAAFDIDTDLRSLQKKAYANSVSKGFHAHGDMLRTRLAKARAHEELVAGHHESGSRERLLAEAAVALWERIYRDYFGNRLMLIVGELSEGHEEVRKGREPDETYFSLSSDSDVMKPEGMPSEAADVAIRLLDLCEEFDIDLAAIIQMKMSFNASRAAMHGGKKF